MSAHSNLARLRVEDPAAAAATAEALWAQLAREDPRMFAALWRRANRPSRRPVETDVRIPIPVQWIEESAPITAIDEAITLDEPAIRLDAQPVPAVNLAPPEAAPEPAPAPAPTPVPAPLMIEPSPALTPVPAPLMIEPSPSLAELLPLDELTVA